MQLSVTGKNLHEGPGNASLLLALFDRLALADFIMEVKLQVLSKCVRIMFTCNIPIIILALLWPYGNCHAYQSLDHPQNPISFYFRHAVDWIQEQSKLRVLSKCGKIMFTLNIPKDYPQSRDITLDKVVGLDDITDLEVRAQLFKVNDIII